MIDGARIDKIKDIGFHFISMVEDMDSTISLIKEEDKVKCRIGKEVKLLKSSHEDYLLGQPGFIYIDNFYEKINSYFIEAFKYYCDSYSVDYTDYDLNDNRFLTLTFWEPGSSIGSHYDSYELDGKTIETDFSAIMYLSEGYDGADIVFENEKEIQTDFTQEGKPGLSIKPLKGDLILFRSSSYHHVNKLISGDRITITQGFIRKGKYD